MLLKFVNFIIIAIAFIYFLYGVRNLHLKVEQNACRMTYMFENPQFSRVLFDANKFFPYYRLFYYNEGPLPVNVNKLVLKGAPIIFIHGNAGSYKQVRSLASVAIRKSMDNDRHVKLDYFTIDFAEELSGLYGGYLLDQERYLKVCIQTVAELYQRSIGLHKQIYLIGHSMGGKLAQAILQSKDLIPYINGILYISSPIDEPVIYADSLIQQYYRKSEEFISSRRINHRPNKDTNVCRKISLGQEQSNDLDGNDDLIYKSNIEKILMISIGGGNRDLLVQDALTTSKYNDFHVMTSSIPLVWLSCDHLSIMWCLQLMLVINRFLFDITKVDRNQNVYFFKDKSERIKSAKKYFTSLSASSILKPIKEINFHEKYQWDIDTKNNSKLIFKTFPKGLSRAYYYLIPEHEQVYVEVFGSIYPKWLKACLNTHQVDNKEIVCKTQLELDHLIKLIPSRSMALINWETVMSYNNFKLSYLMIQLPQIKEKININIDRFKNLERTFYIKYDFKWWLTPYHNNFQVLLNQSDKDALYYLILIEEFNNPVLTIRLKVEPITCEKEKFQAVVKVCIPWARGFEEYHKISDATISNDIYISVPYSPPNMYNTTENPIKVELFLDAKCRFQVSYQYSIAGICSNIILQYYKWLPSHLVAVLLIILTNQYNENLEEKPTKRQVFENNEELTFTNEIATHLIPLTDVFQWSTLYIVIGCHLMKTLLLTWNLIPKEYLSIMDNNSLFVAVIIHSSAIFLSIVLEYFIWFLVVMHGNFLYKIAFSFPVITFHRESFLLTIINALPLTFGVVFISIAIATCSGIALFLASIFYLLMLSNAYKDYWEDLVWRYSVRFFKQLYFNIRHYWKISPGNGFYRLLGILNDTPSNDQMLMNVSNEADDVTIHENNNNESKTHEVKVERNLQRFSFHITLLLLLIVMTAVNMGLMVAWLKSKHDKRRIIKLPDPELWTTTVVIACLSLLLQLKAPKAKYKLVRSLFYICAVLCILICEEYIYYLNQIIAIIFIALTVCEILQR